MNPDKGTDSCTYSPTEYPTNEKEQNRRRDLKVNENKSRLNNWRTCK